ncbi:LTA synthase family protein [Chryseotalea sanaruensis]|nr:LTA synthase family protein [Chryseotalea sanaruensis]
MRARLWIFAKLMLYWMLFMSVIRISFLVYNFDLSSQLTFKEILLSLAYGMPMDLSMAGYVMLLSGLFLTASTLIKGRWIYYALFSLSMIALFLQIIIVIVDIELYRHWGFRMNNTPLFYMGSGALGSIDIWVAIKVLLIGAALAFALVWLYLRWIAPTIWNLIAAPKKSALIFLLLTASMVLCIRGSFTVATMNTGFVYFHTTKMYANHAAINVVWNFFRSLSSSARVVYPETFFDQQLTEKHFQELYPVSDSTYSILNTPKPNVILVIIESYTAAVIEVLGGAPGVTPRINELSKEGIIFDNFYASGTRTDKGLTGILSAYPSQPNSSIIKFPGKTQNLPSLNKKMEALGYRTSFIYGGDADFANFRSYITASGFDALTEDEDFDRDLNNSKWGVHDGFVGLRVLEELDTTQAPFFKVWLTQSSHEPFDVPAKPKFTDNTLDHRFFNSCHYTDSCIGAFIDKLKTRKDWDNTLVILTADHGHTLPGNQILQSKERFQIPLLFLGGALKTDSVIHTVGSQTDIANTLLAQLNAASPEFIFSKNLFANTINQHAAFFFHDGFGFVLPENKLMVYDNTAKIFVKVENVSEAEMELGKAYQQKLYSDFNKR